MNSMLNPSNAQGNKASAWVKFFITLFVLLFVAIGVFGWLEYQKVQSMKADISFLTKNPITDKYDQDFERLSKAVSEQGTKIEPLQKGLAASQAKIEKIDSRLVALEKKAKGNPPVKK